MANNRELSQFARFITVDEGSNNNVGIATTVRISTGGLYVDNVEVIGPGGIWKGPNSGLVGAQGAVGAQGSAGAQGSVGAQGAVGAQGSVGAQGAVGAQGSVGAQGAAGAQGATGPVGGSNTQILYNSSGTAAGSANMTFDGTRPTFATLRTNSILPSGGLPAGASGGGIIQVVSATKTDEASTTSNTYGDITGLSVSITPRSTSNKILILMNVNVGHSNNSTTGWRIVRGASEIAVGTYAGSGYSNSTVGGRISSADDGNLMGFSMAHLDSPATTSSTTYKIQWATQSSTAYLNRASSPTGSSFSRVNCISSITVMEVSG